MAWKDLQDRCNARNLARFGGTALLGWVSVTGDYLDATEAVNLHGIEVAGPTGVFVLASASAPANVTTLPLVIPEGSKGAGRYSVKAARPDGHGLTVLQLEAA